MSTKICSILSPAEENLLIQMQEPLQMSKIVFLSLSQELGKLSFRAHLFFTSYNINSAHDAFGVSKVSVLFRCCAESRLDKANCKRAHKSNNPQCLQRSKNKV